MRYLIADDEIKERDVSRRQKTADQLIEHFQPEEDQADRRILFELTERKLEVEDYHDDTSMEDDVAFNDDGERIFSSAMQNRLSFINEILGRQRPPDEEATNAVEDEDGHVVQMSIPPPERRHRRD